VKGQTVPVSGEITTGCPPILFAGIFLRHPLENTPSLIEDNHFFCMKKNSKMLQNTTLLERWPIIAIKIPIAKSWLFLTTKSQKLYFHKNKISADFVTQILCSKKDSALML
jgi:hypothetical protein